MAKQQTTEIVHADGVFIVRVLVRGQWMLIGDFATEAAAQRALTRLGRW